MDFQFNRISRHYVGGFIALTALLALACSSSCASDNAESDRARKGDGSVVEDFWGVENLIHTSSQIRGAASCAASGCHGGPVVAVSSTAAPRGSEYPLFVENDPHSRSWQTLNSEDSIAILTKLGILRSGVIVQPKAFENCLACHNTDRSLMKDSDSPQFAEGVGCESCHGPSQSWYDAHYQGPASVQRAKSELGLIDTKPLLQRARTCALCHVGAKDRDMNHDIIAAGHPALYFDMAVYHDAYPKHWREAEAGSDAFRAKLWWAGQVAKADAELELIQARANAEHTVSVWPEFANFQCTSCHVTLDGLPSDSTTSPAPGSIAWNVLGRASVRQWNLRGIDLLFEGSNEGSGRNSAANMSSLQELLATLNTPNAPRDTIATRATEVRENLAQLLSQETPSRLDRWTTQSQRQQAVNRLQQSMDTQDWEQAALAYVAAWTAFHAPSSENLREDMSTIRTGLIFPFRSQSPLFPRSDASESRPTRPEWNAAIQQVVETAKSIDP